jgi:branched-subunit amino acid transport protein AzlD
MLSLLVLLISYCVDSRQITLTQVPVDTILALIMHLNWNFAHEIRDL